MLVIAHSYYSLRYGTLSVEDLVDKAVVAGLDYLVLADINNTSGIHDFVKACTEKGIKPIAGIDVFKGNKRLYTLIASDNMGFTEMNTFLSQLHTTQTAYPSRAPAFERVNVLYPIDSPITFEMLPNEFVAIRAQDTTKVLALPVALRYGKMLAVHYISFDSPEGHELHVHLRAVHNNLLLSRLSPDSTVPANEGFFSLANSQHVFANHAHFTAHAAFIHKRSTISFDYKSVKNKRSFTGNRYDDKVLLEKLAIDGMHYRYGSNNKLAAQRVSNELQIIDKLGFSAYFLITWDIIRYSMARGFYHVGRGSGANSVVAYCLKITDVDPIDLDLYFERFINPKRSSPPDFDIDYSWKERDEVTDYIFKRYTTRYTALLGAMSTFRDKSIYRELGKVYGLPKADLDELALNPEVRCTKDDIARKIHSLAQKLADFPNIRSIHAGGILISEEPITAYTALDMPPKGFQTTQWDMYVAEAIGFEKLDILSQRGIGHIKECAEIVGRNRGIKLDVHQVEQFKADARVRDRIKQGETLGCFYIESPAMRGLLKKLRCDNYLTLVAASSIIRPGVAKSGMMREYILRFHNPTGFKYIHPVMEEQLKETFGVMVYQEDVLKVCHHFAGLDLADADVLRRAMSGKFRGKKEMERIVGKFFSNCAEKAYPPEITQEVWRQIASFAGYSFSKAHSASYAVESYQSLYLKAYYPLEFMVAVINNFGGFYHTWVYFNEARRCGAHIQLPCVNKSEYLTTIEGDAIYAGFVHLDGFESKAANAIVVERHNSGPYTSLEDFVNRVPLGLEQMMILIKVGALRFTGKPKAVLLWEVHMLASRQAPNSDQPILFGKKVREYSLPQLVHSPIEDAYDEINILGFPVTMSYFDLLQTTFRGQVMAREMMNHTGKIVRMLGHMVTLKYVKTSKNELMHFGTFLDAEGEIFDSVHFPDSLKLYPFKGRGMYLLLGELTQEFGHPSLTVHKMAKMPLKPDPRAEGR